MNVSALLPAPDWLEKSPHLPPNSDVGDEDPTAIFVEVGRTTHAWEVLEQSLCTLFTYLLGANTLAAMRAYGAITGSGARCDMIEAAAKAWAWENKKPETLTTISAVIRRVRRLAGVRNIIAHGMVAGLSDAERFEVRFEPGSQTNYFLVPAIYNTNKTTDRMNVKIWYNSQTIAESRAAIRPLRDCIEEVTFRSIGSWRPARWVGDFRIIIKRQPIAEPKAERVKRERRRTRVTD